jgi:hypothetical protein
LKNTACRLRNMKKDKKSEEDELRAEYKRSDFPDGLIRGKYAKRLKKSANVIALWRVRNRYLHQ